MSDETWTEYAKNQFLYDITSGSEIDKFLDYSPTNKIISSQIANWSVPTKSLTSSFSGKYKNLYHDIIEIIELQYMNINGEPREQAIRLRAEMARFEVQEKKKGLFGILGDKSS